MPLEPKYGTIFNRNGEKMFSLGFLVGSLVASVVWITWAVSLAKKQGKSDKNMVSVHKDDFNYLIGVAYNAGVNDGGGEAPTIDNLPVSKN